MWVAEGLFYYWIIVYFIKLHWSTYAILPYANFQVKELVIFGRELSASEALQSGLIDRVLWPSAVADQIQSIVKDIAAKPPQVSTYF